MRTALAILILLTASFTHAWAKDKSWQSGEVVSFSSDSEKAGAMVVPIGGALVAGRIYVTRVDVAITNGISVYHCVEMRHGRERLPVLARNAHIQFRVQKGDLVFLDQVGYKHKARILSIE